MEINPTAQIEQQIQVLTAGHELITCQTREEYNILIAQDNTAAGFEKQVAQYWDGSKETPGPVSKAYSLWKDLTTKRGDMLKPLKAFRSAVSRVTGPYLQAEQRKEQERLNALAKQAEEIRRKQEAELAAQAEKLRKEQAAEMARQAKAFKNSPTELARQAEILRQEQAEAQERLAREAQARMIDTSLIPKEAPKVEVGEGRTLVQTWTFDILDESKVPDKYWVIDLSKIKSEVTAFKDKTLIPGIKPRMETSVRRTGK